MDSGGIIKAKGQGAEKLAINARAIQRFVDKPASSKVFGKRPDPNNPDIYYFLKEGVMKDQILPKHATLDGTGFQSFQDMQFRPQGGDEFLDVRRLFDLEGDDLEAAIEALRSEKRKSLDSSRKESTRPKWMAFQSPLRIPTGAPNADRQYPTRVGPWPQAAFHNRAPLVDKHVPCLTTMGNNVVIDLQNVV